jgi:hypothetical protein
VENFETSEKRAYKLDLIDIITHSQETGHGNMKWLRRRLAENRYKVKVKVTLEQAMKAQRYSGCVALLFL